jgi:hypothetical protein
MFEVLVDDGSAQLQTNVEVKYSIGSEVYTTSVKTGTTIAEFRDSLSHWHKGRQIVGVPFEGDEIAQEDAVDARITRSLNTPLQALLARLMQVILEWRGQQFYLAVREGISEKDFKKDAKKRLSIPKKTHTRIEPLGLAAWSVRAGFAYAVMETRKMMITLHDIKGHKHKLQVEGEKPLEETAQILRAEWRLQPWVATTIESGKPFWVEDKGDYAAVTQYDPSLDPRPEITVRVDVADRTYIIENNRAVEDPAAIWDDLHTKYWFQELKVVGQSIESRMGTEERARIIRLENSDFMP